MSRQRPPTRHERYTVLVVVEGATDKAFLTHLKGLYNIRGKRSIQILDGHGGSPEMLIAKARNRSSNASFDKVVVWFDADLIASRAALHDLVRENDDLIILVSRPCVESFYLSILEPKASWVSKTSKDAKRRFHKKYLDETQKTRHASYSKFKEFSISNLNKIGKRSSRSPSSCAEAYELLQKLIFLVFESEDK